MKANDLQGTNPFTLVNMQRIQMKEKQKDSSLLLLLLQQHWVLQAAQWYLSCQSTAAIL